jgi:hypothetical protein
MRSSTFLFEIVIEVFFLFLALLFITSSSPDGSSGHGIMPCRLPEVMMSVSAAKTNDLKDWLA